MTKEFRYFSCLKLDSSVVTSCTKDWQKMKMAAAGAMIFDITQRLKVETSYLAGDYFQALLNIFAFAAPMVW